MKVHKKLIQMGSKSIGMKMGRLYSSILGYHQKRGFAASVYAVKKTAIKLPQKRRQKMGNIH